MDKVKVAATQMACSNNTHANVANAEELICTAAAAAVHISSSALATFACVLFEQAICVAATFTLSIITPWLLLSDAMYSASP